MTDTIREMYSYLSTHTQDPDNSLLGLIATPSFVSEINKIKETAVSLGCVIVTLITVAMLCNLQMG